jgi:glycosyltransferase involved in cell wall biosynthesis
MKQPDNKIRVLHVTSTPSGLGGIEKLLLLIAKRYDSKDFKLFFCNLFSGNDDEPYPSGLKESGFLPYSLKGSSFLDALSFIPKLVYYINKNRIDIVHTWLFHSNFIGQAAAALSGNAIRVLSRQYKDYFYIYNRRFEQKVDKVSHRLAQKIIVCSEGIKKHLIEVEKVPAGKIKVIPNSLDLIVMSSVEDNKQRIISEFGLSGKKCIGVIANLHPRKGHIYLFEALRYIKERNPGIVLLCVGEGSYRRYLQEEAERLNLLSNVIFTGYRDDMPDLISAMDLVVQPSVEEGFGISLIEAMSMNKPVIASDVGGIPEVIGNYRGGILVPAREPKALSESIEKVLYSRDMAKAIGNQGRELVEANFSIGQMMRQYEKIYRELYSQKKAAGR